MTREEAMRYVLEHDPVRRIRLPGLPVSMWDAYKQAGVRGRRGVVTARKVMTPEARAWTDSAVAEALMQTRGMRTLKKRLIVCLTYHCRYRRGDVDNKSKLPLDALTKAQVWQDDRLIDHLFQSREFDQPSPATCWTGVDIWEVSARARAVRG